MARGAGIDTRCSTRGSEAGSAALGVIMSEAGVATATGQSAPRDPNAEVIANPGCVGATGGMDTSSRTAHGRVHGSSDGRTPDSGRTNRPSA